MGLRRGLGRPRRRRVAGDGVPPPADPARAAFAAWSAAGSPANDVRLAGGFPGFPLDLGAAGFRLVYLSPGRRFSRSPGRVRGAPSLSAGPLERTGACPGRPRNRGRQPRPASGPLGQRGRHYVLLSETVPTERFALLAEAAVLLTAPDMTDRLRIALDRATGLLERPCAG